MTNQRLLKMLNQISINLSSHRSVEDAAELVKSHIIKFWSKRMRTEIASVPQKGIEVNEVSRRAIEELKSLEK